MRCAGRWDPVDGWTAGLAAHCLNRALGPSLRLQMRAQPQQLGHKGSGRGDADPCQSVPFKRGTRPAGIRSTPTIRG